MGVDLWPKLAKLEMSGEKHTQFFAGDRLIFLETGLGFSRFQLMCLEFFESHR